MNLQRCPCCGQIIPVIKDRLVLLDKRRRGEFTRSEFADKHGYTLSKAKLELERRVKVSMCAKRKLGRKWLYRNER